MNFTPENLQAKLAARAIRFYVRADSTNDLAAAWLREGAAAGAVVIADEQVKGRGRLGRSWHTPPGVALALSVILRPRSEDLWCMSLLGAVAIAELCEHFGAAQVGIKWPNDVQIAGRKVSGVLPEAVWDGAKLVGVILGMGINVQVDFRGTELEPTAISLETTLGTKLDRVDLLVYLLARIDYWTARLGSKALLDAWKTRLTTLGQTVSVAGASGLIRGVAENVDSQGALLVRGKGGALHRVIAGDIALGASGG